MENNEKIFLDIDSREHDCPTKDIYYPIRKIWSLGDASTGHQFDAVRKTGKFAGDQVWMNDALVRSAHQFRLCPCVRGNGFVLLPDGDGRFHFSQKRTDPRNSRLIDLSALFRLSDALLRGSVMGHYRTFVDVISRAASFYAPWMNTSIRL